MSPEEHYRKLESMYAAAPTNDFYLPKITVFEGESIIEIDVTEKLHHAAGGVHTRRDRADRLPHRLRHQLLRGLHHDPGWRCGEVLHLVRGTG